MQVVELAGAGSPYSFDDSNNDHQNWWHCLFPNKKMEELRSKDAGRALRNKLDSLDPDVVIAGAIAFPSGANAIKWAIKNNKKVIIFDDAKLENTKRPAIIDWIKKQIYSNVDAIFCPSADWDSTFEYYGFKREQIFYGVDVVDNDFWETDGDFILLNNLPSNFILTVGRQIERKNFILLLKAYKYYSKKSKNSIPLILVGEGVERKKLEEFVDLERIKNIHFFPFQSQKDLVNFYKKAVLFVVPSKNETWGLVVNEAMASGLPVIVSDKVGCASTLISRGVNGFIFSSNNYIELAELLLEFDMMLPEIKKNMGNMSKTKIKEWGLDRFNTGIYDAINFVWNKKSSNKKLIGKLLVKKWGGRYNQI